MRKFTLLFLALLGAVGAKAQGEYVAYQPTAPEKVYYVSDKDNHQPDVKFPFIKAGDVIKIHYTNVSSECSIIWRGKTTGEWKWESILTGSNGVLSYTVPSSDQTYASETCTPEEIVASLKARGLALTGGFNLLAITVTDNNSQLRNTSQTLLTDQNIDLDNWGHAEPLASYDFSTAKVGDVLNITYTTYSTLDADQWATIQLQSNTKYGSVEAWKAITSACSQGTQSTNTQQTLNITVDEPILTALQKGYAIIMGGYVYLNSVSITSSNNILINTLFSEDCAFGNWDKYYSTDNSTYFTVAKTGDILSIAYSVSEGNSGELQLIDTSNNWQKYSDSYAVSGLSGTGTTNFIIDDDLLVKLKAGNIAIKGAGNITGKGVSLKMFTTAAGYRPVYIPASRYATFYGESTCALPDGVDAYYVSETTSETAKLTSISNIPANQGVILHGAEGIYQLYATTDEAASVSDNKLVGSTSRQQITDTSNKYVLYNNSGTPEFRKITVDTYLDAYKCYLNTAGATPARLSIVFDDSETAINTVEAQGRHALDDGYYTLSGQRVEQPTKGLYIKNGKKYIIK